MFSQTAAISFTLSAPLCLLLALATLKLEFSLNCTRLWILLVKNADLRQCNDQVLMYIISDGFKVVIIVNEWRLLFYGNSDKRNILNVLAFISNKFVYVIRYKSICLLPSIVMKTY